MRIDVHQHYLLEDGYLERLLREMDANDVAKCVMHGAPLRIRGQGLADNDKVLEAARKYKDRILPSAHIDPRAPDACQAVRRYKEEGFRCFKIFPPLGFMPSDPAFEPVFAEIESTGLPVVVHTGLTTARSSHSGTRESDCRFAQPIYVDGLLRRHPRTTFIMTHMGDPWFLEALAISALNPNAFIDCSGTAWKGMEICATSGYPIAYQRFIWGCGMMEMAKSIEEWTLFFKVIKQQDMINRFFFENAREIFEIEN